MVDYKNNLLATYYMYICMYESNGHCTALHEFKVESLFT